MIDLGPNILRRYIRSRRFQGDESDLTIEERRRRFELQTAALWVPRDVSVEPVSAGGVPAEWVTPRRAHTDAAIIYLHGGAYIIGSPRSHRGLVARIAQAAGMRTLSVDYRLAPEHPFPAGRDDVLTAFHWLVAHGYAPERIIFAGDSAGGGLTLSTLLTLRDRHEAMPGGAALISPWTDLEGVVASRQTRAASDPYLEPGDSPAARAYANGRSLSDPMLSPIHADLQGLPPLLIQVGTDEILLDDSTVLAARAKRAGVPVKLEIWKGVWHVWHFFEPVLGQAHQAIRRIGEFARERVGV